MDSLLELQRRLHEQVDRLQAHAVDCMLDMPKSHKGRLRGEHYLSRVVDRIAGSSKQLSRLYEIKDEDPKRLFEINGLTPQGGGDFSRFYEDLAEIKDHYRRYPGATTGLRDEGDVEYAAVLRECQLTDAEAAAMFGGEEGEGRYLDLTPFHREFVDLTRHSSIDYLAYLDRVSDFSSLGDVRRQAQYLQYLERLYAYLVGFFARVQPLLDIGAMESAINVANDPNEDDATEHDSLYCEPCRHQFTNAAVFQAHLPGKKHQKALTSAKATVVKKKPDAKMRRVAWLEAAIAAIIKILQDVREDTKTSVERRSTLTVEERREDEQEVADAAVEDDAKRAKRAKKGEDDDEEGEKFYNPLKLPLDWDGKPIPYWLWKLHGLGLKFTCEICGNYEYAGRKAFDQHFFEWRHANAMRSLGIPNSRHFFQITNISDAQTLWEKVRGEERATRFKPEAMEEFEDQHGNVYNRRTYEDLKRQGLL